MLGTSLLWRATVAFTYLKVKSAKCLCFLPVVLVMLTLKLFYLGHCKKKKKLKYYFGLGVKNLVLFTSLVVDLQPCKIWLCPTSLLYVVEVLMWCVVMTGWEMCNKYQIKNSLGQLVYFATEGSSFSLPLTRRVFRFALYLYAGPSRTICQFWLFTWRCKSVADQRKLLSQRVATCVDDEFH